MKIQFVSEESKEQIVSEILAGASRKAVCKKHEIAASTFHIILFEKGLRYREVVFKRHAEKPHNKKYNEENLFKCIELYYKLGRMPGYREIKEVIGKYEHVIKYKILTEEHIKNEIEKPMQSMEIKSEPKSREELMDELKQLTRSLNKIPSLAEYKLFSKLSDASFLTYWTSYFAAVNEAGLFKILEEMKTTSKKKVLIEYLVEKAKVLGRAPSKKEIRYDPVHSYMQYYRLFGSYKKAVQESGLSDVCAYKKQQRNNRRQELLIKLKSLEEELKRTPTEEDIIKEGKKHLLTEYKKHFGSLAVACRKAGMDVKFTKKADPYYSNENLLQHVRDLAAKAGHAPQHKHFTASKKYSYPLYMKRFGSLGKTIEAAGLAPYKSHRAYGDCLLKKEDALDWLRNYFTAHGYAPSIKTFKEQKIISNYAVYKLFGSYPAFYETAGIPYADKRYGSAFTREELLAALKKKFEETGRVPKAIDLRTKNNLPPFSKFLKEFGSLKAALIEAGMKTTAIPRKKKYSRDELTALLIKRFEQTGRILTTGDFKPANGLASLGVYKKTFGSLRNAFAEAGIDVSNIFTRKKYLREEVIELLKGHLLKNGFIKTADFGKNGLPSYMIIRKYFGTLNNALKETGFDLSKVTTRGKHTHEELLSILIKRFEKSGQIPGYTEFKPSNGLPSLSVYIKHFGSLQNAFLSAGFDVSNILKKKRYLREEVIELLKGHLLKNGFIKTVDLGKNGLPSYVIIRKYFGDLNNALKATGVKNVKPLRQSYSKTELLEALKNAYSKLGRKPLCREMKAYGLPSYTQYHKVFGSMSGALYEAGLTTGI